MKRLAMFVVLVVGCVETPNGRFACEDDDECPNGWSCRPDGLCYRTAADAAVGVDGGCVEGSCPLGEECRGGACVIDEPDRDRDGVPASLDCDDEDRLVGGSAVRPCMNECAQGLETCTAAVWSACDAPTCNCEVEGETRSVACGMCGTLTQTCLSGQWTSPPGGVCAGEGACMPGLIESGGSCDRCGVMARTCTSACQWSEYTCGGSGVCAAGATETVQQGCGMCGATQSRTRTCNADCTWGDYGAWGTCTMGPVVCTPGAVDTQRDACGNCGSRERSRTCLGDCTWGAFESWSACGGQGECAADTVESDTRGCGNCGQQSRSRTCSSSCSWGAWSAYGTCSGQGECAAGAVENGSQPCGFCGSQPGSRTCSSSCSWGAWSYGACQGGGECAPGTYDFQCCFDCCPHTTRCLPQERICEPGCFWGFWYDTGFCEFEPF